MWHKPEYHLTHPPVCTLHNETADGHTRMTVKYEEAGQKEIRFDIVVDVFIAAIAGVAPIDGEANADYSNTIVSVGAALGEAYAEKWTAARQNQKKRLLSH
jgi:hypothetical protein